MHEKRPRKNFQEILVEVLDMRIPAENLANRKRISVREAILRKLIELAERGYPPAVALIVEFYSSFDVAAARESERKKADEAHDKAWQDALERWGRPSNE
jgi:hypothetical protein